MTELSETELDEYLTDWSQSTLTIVSTDGNPQNTYGLPTTNVVMYSQPSAYPVSVRAWSPSNNPKQRRHTMDNTQFWSHLVHLNVPVMYNYRIRSWWFHGGDDS